MTDETYSPSLDLAHGKLEVVGQELPLSVTTSDVEEVSEISAVSAQLELLDASASLRVMKELNFPSRILGAAAIFPTEILVRSVASYMGTVSNAVVPAAEVVSSAISRSMRSVSYPWLDSNAVEPPQVENRGWKDHINSAEYEARLNAISPRSANIEAEDYAPPTPLGKVRTIHRG